MILFIFQLLFIDYAYCTGLKDFATCYNSNSDFITWELENNYQIYTIAYCEFVNYEYESPDDLVPTEYLRSIPLWWGATPDYRLCVDMFN